MWCPHYSKVCENNDLYWPLGFLSFIGLHLVLVQQIAVTRWWGVQFLLKKEAHELHQHFGSLCLLLHLRSRRWGDAAGGRWFRVSGSVQFGCWEHLHKAGWCSQGLVVVWSISWVPGWIPTLRHLKRYRMPVHELLIQVLSSQLYERMDDQTTSEFKTGETIAYPSSRFLHLLLWP